MERLLVKTAHGHDTTVQLAQRVPQGFPFRLVFHHPAALHQRVLPEEVTLFVDGLLEQRGALRHSELHAPADDGAEPPLGNPARQQLPLADERPHNPVVVGADVGGLERQGNRAVGAVRDADNELGQRVHGRAETQRDVVDDSVSLHNGGWSALYKGGGHGVSFGRHCHFQVLRVITSMMWPAAAFRHKKDYKGKAQPYHGADYPEPPSPPEGPARWRRRMVLIPDDPDFIVVYIVKMFHCSVLFRNTPSAFSKPLWRHPDRI